MKNLLKTMGLLFAMNTFNAEAQTPFSGYPLENKDPKKALELVNATIAPNAFDADAVEISQSRDPRDKTVTFTVKNPSKPNVQASYTYLNGNNNLVLEPAEMIDANYTISDAAGGAQNFNYADHMASDLTVTMGKNYSVTETVVTNGAKRKETLGISETQTTGVPGRFDRFSLTPDTSSIGGEPIYVKKSETEASTGLSLLRYNTGIITRQMNGTDTSTDAKFSIYSANFTANPRFSKPMPVVSGKLEQN